MDKSTYVNKSRRYEHYKNNKGIMDVVIVNVVAMDVNKIVYHVETVVVGLVENVA